MLTGTDYEVVYGIEQHLFGSPPYGLAAVLAYAAKEARLALRANFCDETYGALRLAIVRSHPDLEFRKKAALGSLGDPRVPERFKEAIRGYAPKQPPLPEPAASPEPAPAP